MKNKITITANIKERDFVESLLNMKHSGVTDNYLLLCMGFYALAKRWNSDKMVYYTKLLDIKNEK